MVNLGVEADEAAMKVSVVPVTPFQQNCSIVWCVATGKGAVVDPGGDVARIYEAVERTGADVEMVLITHGHLDHASATRVVAEHYAVPIVGPHRGDAFLISQLREQGRRFGLAEADTFEPDRWLDDGDTVTLGRLELQVIHCPGHTPGHVVFYEPESRFALVGDVIFNGSVGRTDLPRGSFEQLAHGIRRKLFPLGDEVRFLPGHGSTSTFGWERKCNPFVADLAFDD